MNQENKMTYKSLSAKISQATGDYYANSNPENYTKARTALLELKVLVQSAGCTTVLENTINAAIDSIDSTENKRLAPPVESSSSSSSSSSSEEDTEE
jgi:hypothetical protein